MSNRCYIDFEEPNQTSPDLWLYEGSMADNEDDVSFSFDGPPGLLDRAKQGDQYAINELLGRMYMGTEGNGQDMMGFHWEKGFMSPSEFPDLAPTLSIDEATGVVFAEHARSEMEKDTALPESASSAPRI